MPVPQGPFSYIVGVQWGGALLVGGESYQNVASGDFMLRLSIPTGAVLVRMPPTGLFALAGGPGDGIATVAMMDRKGNFLVGANAADPNNLIPPATQPSRGSAFMKYDRNGALLWRRIEPVEDSFNKSVLSPSGVGSDSDNNYFILWNEGNTAGGTPIAYLARYSEDGSLVWKVKVEDGTTTRSKGMMVSPEGICVVAIDRASMHELRGYNLSGAQIWTTTMPDNFSILGTSLKSSAETVLAFTGSSTMHIVDVRTGTVIRTVSNGLIGGDIGGSGNIFAVSKTEQSYSLLKYDKDGLLLKSIALGTDEFGGVVPFGGNAVAAPGSIAALIWVTSSNEGDDFSYSVRAFDQEDLSERWSVPYGQQTGEIPPFGGAYALGRSP